MAESHLPDRVSSLDPRRRALFEKRLAQLSAGSGAAAQLRAGDRSGVLPLSFAQQRLWFLDQLAPGSPFYSMSAAWRLSGRADVAALEAALSAVVTRHEVLRTRFTAEAGVPGQVVGDPWPVAVEVSEAAEEEAQAAASAVAAEPFDLASGRLLRARLLRLGSGDDVLVVVMHHIVCDVWSLDVLGRDLWTAYGQAARGGAAVLGRLPVQYGDFACWQRSWLSADELRPRLSWWREYLAGAPGALELPADWVRQGVASARGGSVRFEVPGPVAAGLRKVAAASSATLFMVLLAGFEVVLARWAGAADVVVGVPVAGRQRAELDELVGFFVNTLPVRVRLDGDPVFGEVLARVRESVVGALGHQEVPFEALVEDLAPERDLSRNPLVQVTFQLLNTPGGEQRRAGTRAGDSTAVPWGDRERARTHFDISVRLVPAGEGMRGEVVYAADVFARPSMTRLAGWLTGVLEQVAAGAAGRISELDLPGGPGWRTLAAGHPAPARPGGGAGVPAAGGFAAGTLPAGLAGQAARVPEAAAVAWDGGELSYAELAAAGRRLAGVLAGLGAGPERVTGICAGPGAALAAGLWGVLLAGGAYLVLDPGDPAARLGMLTARAAAGVLVAAAEDAAAAGEAAAAAGAALVLLDADGEVIAVSPRPVPEPVPRAGTVPGPGNLAAVSFTSGSTGLPKGVMVTHDHVVSYVSWCLAELPIGRAGVVPLASPAGFAGSVLPLFGAWLSGRCVVLGSREDPLSWCERVSEAAFVQATPTVLRFIGERFGRCWDRWGCLLLGSEPVGDAEWDLVAGMDELDVIVHYGTTETNASALWQGGPGRRGQPNVVGRPAAGARLVVADRWGSPAGPGIPGEVLAGGRSVARGYLGQPALTAERFVPDPAGAPGSRAFRTGDLARWQEDGTLEFIGRADDQVKIRGYRVEPGEVEAVLARHPAVAVAAVGARPGPSGSPRLIAWVVLAAGAATDPGKLRDWAAGELPDYMVPSAVVAVTALPVTAHGKLDRAALPDPGGSRQDWEGPAAAPRTPAEELLVQMWASVLGRDQVGIDDNFFALGGHSLLAVRLISDVRDVLGVDYPLTALFERPTVRAMAAAIDQEMSSQFPR